METYWNPDGLDPLTIALALTQCPRTAMIEFVMRKPNSVRKAETWVLCFDHFFNYVAGGLYNDYSPDGMQRQHLIDWLWGSPAERILLIGNPPNRVCRSCDTARHFHGHSA